MKVIWLLDAIDDRHAIFDYIELDSPHRAILVDERILEAANGIASFPETGRPGRKKGTREWIVQDTQYIIAYVVRSERIEILRVVHGKRRWPRLKPRLPH